MPQALLFDNDCVIGGVYEGEMAYSTGAVAALVEGCFGHGKRCTIPGLIRWSRSRRNKIASIRGTAMKFDVFERRCGVW